MADFDSLTNLLDNLTSSLDAEAERLKKQKEEQDNERTRKFEEEKRLKELETKRKKEEDEKMRELLLSSMATEDNKEVKQPTPPVDDVFVKPAPLLAQPNKPEPKRHPQPLANVSSLRSKFEAKTQAEDLPPPKPTTNFGSVRANNNSSNLSLANAFSSFGNSNTAPQQTETVADHSRKAKEQSDAMDRLIEEALLGHKSSTKETIERPPEKKSSSLNSKEILNLLNELESTPNDSYQDKLEISGSLETPEVNQSSSSNGGSRAGTLRRMRKPIDVAPTEIQVDEPQEEPKEVDYEDLLNEFVSQKKDIKPNDSIARRLIVANPRGISTRKLEDLTKLHNSTSFDESHYSDTHETPVANNSISEELYGEDVIRKALEELGSLDPLKEGREDPLTEVYDVLLAPSKDGGRGLAPTQSIRLQRQDSLDFIPPPAPLESVKRPTLDEIPPPASPGSRRKGSAQNNPLLYNTLAAPSRKSGRASLTKGIDAPISNSANTTLYSNSLRKPQLDIDAIVSGKSRFDSVRVANSYNPSSTLPSKSYSSPVPTVDTLWKDYGNTIGRKTKVTESSGIDSDYLLVNKSKTLFVQSTSSPDQRQAIRRPTPNLAEILLTISQVDGSNKNLVVTADFTVQDVIYAYADKISLWQTEYFSIAARSPTGVERWLNPLRTLADEGVTTNTPLVFKMKFFKQPKKLVDSVASHMYYLQVYRNVVTGYWKVPTSIALRLAALQLQIVFGDIDKSKHRAGYFDEKTLQPFLPESIIKMHPADYLEKMIFAMYSELRNTQAAEAKLRYLTTAREVSVFGASFYEVTESGISRSLGIAEDGLFLSVKDNKESFDFYPFTEVDSWDYSSFGVEIRLNNPMKKPLFEFSTQQGEAICDTIAGYYILLRCQVSGRDAANGIAYAGTLPDFQLFSLPYKRNVYDPNYSRLELFRNCYVEEVSKAKAQKITKLMEQIDHHLCAHPHQAVSPDAFDISNIDMTDGHLEIISIAIDRTTRHAPRADHILIENMDIKEVNLANNVTLTPDSATYIGRILESPFPIKKIDLSFVNLGPQGAKLLSSYLERDNRLEQLIIPHANLTNKGVTVILQSISKKPQYTHMDFNWNELDEKIIDTLVDTILHKPHLAQLSIGGNKIGDNGVKALLAAFRKVQTKFKTIETLDLSNAKLEKSTKLVIEWLSENPQVQKLYLSRAKMSDKSAMQFAKCLIESRMVSIDIKGCDISDKPMRDICNCIGSSKKLQDVSIGGSIIKKKAGELLISSIEMSRTMTSLSLRNCYLSKSTLVNLLKAIKKSRSLPLRILDLAMNNEVSNGDVAEELEDLLANGKLEDLNVADCDLSSKHLQTIISGVARSTSLKRLHVDANKLGKDIVKIANAIKAPSNTHLEELTMRKCDISIKNLYQFMEALGNNSTLVRIALERNYLDSPKALELTKRYPSISIKL